MGQSGGSTFGRWKAINEAEKLASVLRTACHNNDLDVRRGLAR
jgi:hypothetical protein